MSESGGDVLIMAVTFKILHVYECAVAFSIDFDTYFLRTVPFTQIFNSDMMLQSIPNIDSWFQAKTHQRYSLRSVLDMMSAYRDALDHTYSIADLEEIAKQSAIAARTHVLTERMSDYSKLYWIEITDPDKLESVHIANIREKFEFLKSKLGVDGLFNYLCRLLVFATINRRDVVPVLERLILRLEKIPGKPIYPSTEDLDKDLQTAVLTTVFNDNITMVKGVDILIQHKLRALTANSDIVKN